ncbi:hypothetical protein [Granulosicoccus antarcticus]|nr:hypothetical protein [Granulosicoccus antarcticus]
MTHSRITLITDASIDIGQRIANGLDAADYNRALNDIKAALPVNGVRAAH